MVAVPPSGRFPFTFPDTVDDMPDVDKSVPTDEYENDISHNLAGVPFATESRSVPWSSRLSFPIFHVQDDDFPCGMHRGFAALFRN